MHDAKHPIAVDGGQPVREKMLPYGHQLIEEEDWKAVIEVLKSDWLTTGPKVEEFENEMARRTHSRYAIAVSSGTAALHAAMYALDVQQGDEVIVPTLSFAASSNCVLYQGGKPVFVDVDPDTLLLDTNEVESKINPKTKAIVSVDLAGQPCDYDALNKVAEKYSLPLVDDASHSIGGWYKDRPVGSLAHLNTFSFHPVKTITTGEGGMITTNNLEYASRMKQFRNHGIATDFRQRESVGSWYYEMVGLGYNYRLTDMQCALGIAQLNRLAKWVDRRTEIAGRYNDAFSGMKELQIPRVCSERKSAWHLYIVQLNLDHLRVGRKEVFQAMRAEHIGVNVHYIPIPWHPFYKGRGYLKGDWPSAERAYERILSLPIFPAMSERDIDDVINAMKKVLRYYAK